MSTETMKVDVLASLDREIERAGGEAYPVGKKLIATRDAVAELIEAANERLKDGSGKMTKAEHRLSAALARAVGCSTNAETKRVDVFISETMRNEYDTRDVFGGLPEGSMVCVDVATARELLADAEFNGDSKHGPEYMSVGTRQAYRSLVIQLRKTLARVGGAKS
jgi:hypothetical protein